MNVPTSNIGKELKNEHRWEIGIDPKDKTGEIAVQLNELEFVPESYWIFAGFAGEFQDMRIQNKLMIQTDDGKERYVSLVVTNDKDFLLKQYAQYDLPQKNGSRREVKQSWISIHSHGPLKSCRESPPSLRVI